jgi:U3 small nucleolar ribonucleoprotein protein IMP4
MQRRTARLRGEYLYKKSKESIEAANHAKKQSIRLAKEKNVTIPTEIQSEANELNKEIQLEDEKTAALTSHVDDEYSSAGLIDPNILITTSRDPSTRLINFSKELRLIFPNSQRINRGNTVINEIVAACKQNNISDLIIIHEHRGEPDGLIITHFPYGPTAYFGLSNVVLRHDLTQANNLDNMSEAYPHLIFDNFTSNLGIRTNNILKHLFPVPKPESSRILTFANRNDQISFRHHRYKSTGHKQVELGEVGPRFELNLYQIKLGTVEQSEAENEWVYRPYHNTTKKRKLL